MGKLNKLNHDKKYKAGEYYEDLGTYHGYGVWGPTKEDIANQFAAKNKPSLNAKKLGTLAIVTAAVSLTSTSCGSGSAWAYSKPDSAYVEPAYNHTCSTCGQGFNDEHEYLLHVQKGNCKCAETSTIETTTAAPVEAPIVIPVKPTNVFEPAEEPTITEPAEITTAEITTAGVVKTEPKHVHNYRWITTRKATCNRTGEMELACSGCGDVDQTKEIAKKEHDMKEDLDARINPTCDYSGRKYFYCGNGCGHTEVSEISALGHNYSGNYVKVKGPTQTEYGEERDYCQNDGCNDYRSRKIEKLSGNTQETKQSHTHAYGNWTNSKDPTCDTAGQKQRICTDPKCTDPIKGLQYETIPAVGHRYGGNYVVAEEPTVAKTGEKRDYCLNGCGKYNSITIEKLPTPILHTHEYGNWAVTQDAICEIAGQKQRVCTDPNCPDPNKGVETESTQALGHRFGGNYEVVKEPTLTETGEKRDYCLNGCGAFNSITIEKLPEILHTHEYGNDGVIIKDPTCEIAGEKQRECTDPNCTDQNKGRQVESIPAVGHRFSGNYEVVTGSSEQRDYCSNGCGKYNALIEEQSGINLNGAKKESLYKSVIAQNKATSLKNREAIQSFLANKY